MTEKSVTRRRQRRVGVMTEENRFQIDWLRDAMALRGKSQAAVARMIGLTRDKINKTLMGRRELRYEEMVKLSAELNVPMPDLGTVTPDNAVGLTATTTRKGTYIMCVGEVQAGAWKEVAFTDFDEFSIEYVADPKWPEGAVKALRVRGNSINLKAADGDYVAVLDVNAAPRAFQDRDWVVVNRTRGQTLESTVKQVRLVGQEWQLWPSSSDPRYQEPLVLPLNGMSDEDEVRIVGFVLDFVKPATRF